MAGLTWGSVRKLQAFCTFRPPFLLARVAEITGGDSLASNIQLVYNNARLAAQTAAAYCQL